jgi:hypothetical protein
MPSGTSLVNSDWQWQSLTSTILQVGRLQVWTANGAVQTRAYDRFVSSHPTVQLVQQYVITVVAQMRLTHCRNMEQHVKPKATKSGILTSTLMHLLCRVRLQVAPVSNSHLLGRIFRSHSREVWLFGPPKSTQLWPTRKELTATASAC